MINLNDSSNDGHRHAERIEDVILEYRRRRSSGENVSEESLIAAHPDLMPALGEELRKLRIIDAARERLAHARSAETATFYLNPPDTHRGDLEVRCPNCHTPMIVAADTMLTELNCETCGSSFSLINENQADVVPLSTIGRFELIGRIGVGSFGVVWKARDNELDRIVALKVPRHGGMDRDEQERFLREAQAAAQLRHSNIVSVHEVGRESDSVYIVSDFINGISLDEWLVDQLLTVREAAALCLKIAMALHHAHEHGVIHRDLKPANIMMDANAEPHVTDFGLARREAGEVTVSLDGRLIGTPAYMSPEQARGEGQKADRRSDIYSLGVILFQLLTGELPFRGNVRMMLSQVVHDEPPSPRSLNLNVSKDLETITLKCLEKEPPQRFASAEELGAELQRVLAGEPIQSRPISRLERGFRWCKRRRALSASLLATALLVITTIGWGVREIYTERRAKAQLSENLLTTAELFGRRGEWTEALDQIEQARSLGSSDPVRLEIARVKALQALNRLQQSRAALDTLAARQDLGPHLAEVRCLQGIALLTSENGQEGVKILQSVKQIGGLSRANEAIVDALIADNSERALRDFRSALVQDPFNHEAHAFLVFALTMAGEREEALERAGTAMLLFPDDPNFPLLAAYVESMDGNAAKMEAYLNSAACQQIQPELLSNFRIVLEEIPKIYESTLGLWDFDHSGMSPLFEGAERDSAGRLLAAIGKAGGFDIATDGVGGFIGLFPSKGPVWYQSAYKVFDDLLSLQTMGFLMNGDGDLDRIDTLIEKLERSAEIHHDGLFDFCRGRLLYRRDRLAEATEAFAIAAQRRSLFGDMPKLAFYAAARCEFERYQRNEQDSLARAAEFVRSRLSAGPIRPLHAERLFTIAMAAKDFESARALVKLLDEQELGKDEISYRRAQVEYEDENFVAAMRLCRQVGAQGPRTEDAKKLLKQCQTRLTEFLGAQSDPESM